MAIGWDEALTGDGPHVELMATYAALGDLLDSGRSDPELRLDCEDLVRRLVKVGVWVERHSEQRWALWMARNTTFGGEREQ